MITKENLSEIISAGLSVSYINVKGDDGQHFEAVVVSPTFEGMSTVKQHQMVYAALGNRMQSGEVHALALKTFSPTQWQTTEK